jgi:hypothetical protein
MRQQYAAHRLAFTLTSFTNYRGRRAGNIGAILANNADNEITLEQPIGA